MIARLRDVRNASERMSFIAESVQKRRSNFLTNLNQPEAANLNFKLQEIKFLNEAPNTSQIETISRFLMQSILKMKFEQKDIESFEKIIDGLYLLFKTDYLQDLENYDLALKFFRAINNLVFSKSSIELQIDFEKISDIILIFLEKDQLNHSHIFEEVKKI